MILTLGRSGSNTLVDLLNQHPQVLNINEVMETWTPPRKLRDRLGLYRNRTADYLDAMTRPSVVLRFMLGVRNLGRLIRGKPHEIKPLRRIRTIGIKDFALFLDKEGLRDWPLQQTDLKIIGLRRRDVLARVLSWQMLDKTGVVASRGEHHGQDRAITLDPAEFLRALEVVEAENRLLSEMLAALPADRVFVIDYEDFFQDAETRQAILAELFSFLGVDPWTSEIRMKKIISVPPAEMIRNRDACAAGLIGTRFEGLLDS